MSETNSRLETSWPSPDIPVHTVGATPANGQGLTVPKFQPKSEPERVLAGYWQSDKSRFTACIVHASGGPDNYGPLFEFYNTTWSKTFDTSGAGDI